MEDELVAEERELAPAEDGALGVSESGSDDHEDADMPVEDGDDPSGEDESE